MMQPKDPFSISGLIKKEVSPLNSPVWRLLLCASAGCGLAWLFHNILSYQNLFAIWVVALLLLAGWVLAVRMLLLVSKLKRFWIVWLAGGFLLILIFTSSSRAWLDGFGFSLVFLIFRRYKPYAHLVARRKAATFLIGLAAVFLLTFAWPLKPAIDASKLTGAAALGQNLETYALWSFRFFWLFTLLSLFFSVKLHFMKLRPKLAISAFLIAVVPIVLILATAIAALYGTLGESRAIRAATILKDWAGLAATDKEFMSSISGQSFSQEKSGDIPQSRGKPPSWLPEFNKALSANKSLFRDLSSQKVATFVWVEPEIWLVDLKGFDQIERTVRGCLVDTVFLSRLARIVHSDVVFSFNNPVTLRFLGREVISADKKAQPRPKTDIYGTFLEEGGPPSTSTDKSTTFASRSLYFGMTNLDIIVLENGKVKKDQILLILKTTLSTIAGEFVSEKNPLSAFIMAGLISAASVLLILEAFALFFGVRITAGITSAVSALHKGIKRMASGDLETKIIIPNEDELGLLAASFNEMAAAVKRGREEAVTRESLEREIEIAREIQERLLPHQMPQVSGFEITGTSLPSQQVGGDYFDFLDMGSERLGVAIGDVSGKGIPAALLMANLQASLHGQALESGDVGCVVERMNNLLVQSTDSHMFATFFYGILDRKASSFTSTNAGHNPPILFRKNGEILRLKEGGLILGFLPNQKYLRQTIILEAGDVIVLYTDGITEAAASTPEIKEDRFFGEKRLVELVQANLARSAGEIQSGILQALTEYIGKTPQNDDITLVVIKRKEI